VQIRDRIKELRRVPASELIPNPKNWRTHPVAQQDALRGVLAEVGYADALLARETPAGLMLVDGHLRAETTPDADVPVLVLDINEAEADLMLATLDPLAAMAGRDEERLKELLSTVSSDNDTVNALLQTLANGYEPLTIPEPEPPDEGFDADGAMDDVEADDYEPTVQRGEVWSLGQHRLMCGDATEPSHHDRLIAGDSIDLVLTDPPYGVGVGYGAGVSGSQTFGDNSDYVERFVPLVMPLLRRWPVVLITPGQFNIWTYPRASWILSWVIPAGVGLNPWGFTTWHAVLAYGADPYLRNGLGSRPDGVTMSATRDADVAGHPVAKPMGVWSWLLERGSTKKGEAVLDPFVGSGTTIIAAERLGRRCYAMEIEPRYCDVSIKRWEDYTGQKAVKV